MKLSALGLRRFAAAALLAGTALTATAGAASAQWYRGTPPPPRYEQHAYRAGYTWETGHWAWSGHRWFWQRGRYIAFSRGHHWIGGHWAFGPYGRRWVPGHWS